MKIPGFPLALKRKTLNPGKMTSFSNEGKVREFLSSREYEIGKGKYSHSSTKTLIFRYIVLLKINSMLSKKGQSSLNIGGETIILIHFS